MSNLDRTTLQVIVFVFHGDEFLTTFLETVHDRRSEPDVERYEKMSAELTGRLRRTAYATGGNTLVVTDERLARPVIVRGHA